jgi:hypothetical protein
MAEPPRTDDPNAPQNPPRSVVNPQVRRSALWTYLAPIVVFFAGVAVALVYWGTSPPRNGGERIEQAEGTTGTERERSRDATPGGHDPNRAPSRPQDEVERRAGEALSELRELFEDGSRDVIGRRIELQNVTVERVDSPALFWVRDGDARAAVTAPAGGASVRAGQSVNLTGTVERTGEGVRIRASRVAPNR